MTSENTFVKAYARLANSCGPPKTSFTLEVTDCHIPLVKGFVVPLAMGMEDSSCPIVIEAGSKQFQGSLYYDAQAQGYRVGSAKRFAMIADEVGAHIHDILVFQLISRDSVTGLVRVKLSKHSPSHVERQGTQEATSSSLRRLTLVAAKCFTSNKLTEGVLDVLLLLMDHREVTAFLEFILQLVKERKVDACDIQNGLYSTMCRVVTSSTSTHVGFAALCTTLFQFQSEVTGEGHHYEFLDYMLYTFGKDHMAVSCHMVPNVELRTLRRFPRTSIMLLYVELHGRPTIYRGQKILTMLCSVDILEPEDDVLLRQLASLFEKEMLFVYQTTVNMAQQFLMRPIYSSYSSVYPSLGYPQLSCHALRPGRHLC